MPVHGASTGLDETVARLRAALQERSVPRPDALYLCATGVGALADELRQSVELTLGELDVPEPWEPRVLHAGRLGRAVVWVLEDAAGDPLDAEPSAPWAQALPVWLAAASGAQVLVHCSAGTLLPQAALHAAPGAAGADGESAALASLPAADLPAFAVARDHIHLGGASPLVGLGTSRLGPLFPDLSRLHHAGLRAAALEAAARLGSSAVEAVVACTAGPALETPAERRMLARLGAEVAVQALAPPLLAAGHAGLAVLALVALVAGDEEVVDVARLLERTRALEPRLDELQLALAPEVAAVALSAARGSHPRPGGRA